MFLFFKKGSIVANLPAELEESANEFHSRILRGDPIASAEIAEKFLPVINERLSKKFRGIDDPNLIDTAVVDAFFSYLDNPQKFNPEKTNLLRYLLMSARGDLQNLLAREKNKKIISLTEDVELLPSQQEYRIETVTLSSEDNVEQTILIKTSPVWNLIKEYLPNATDQEFLNLLMENVRDTNEYAKLLGIQALPPKEQRIIVKRHKDRIKKVITRKISRNELE